MIVSPVTRKHIAQLLASHTKFKKWGSYTQRAEKKEGVQSMQITNLCDVLADIVALSRQSTAVATKSKSLSHSRSPHQFLNSLPSPCSNRSLLPYSLSLSLSLSVDQQSSSSFLSLSLSLSRSLANQLSSLTPPDTVRDDRCSERLYHA